MSNSLRRSARVAVLSLGLLAPATAHALTEVSSTFTTAGSPGCTFYIRNAYSITINYELYSRGRTGSGDIDCAYFEVSIGGTYDNALSPSTAEAVRLGNVKTTSGAGCSDMGWCFSSSVTRP